MRWKVYAAIWIITVLALWIFGSLILATIESGLGTSGIEDSEMIMTYLTNPMGILACVVIGTILSPCCYCYGISSE